MSKITKKLNKLASNQKSNWLYEAKKRQENNAWLKKSQRIALTILITLKERGMTKQQLASRIGVSSQKINKIVKGKEELTLETINNLEKVLNIVLIPKYTIFFRKIKEIIKWTENNLKKILNIVLVPKQNPVFLGVSSFGNSNIFVNNILTKNYSIAAASISFLLIGIIVIFVTTRQNDTGLLAENNKTDIKEEFAERSNNSNSSDKTVIMNDEDSTNIFFGANWSAISEKYYKELKKNAISVFEKKEYKSACEGFEKLIEKNDKDAEVLYYSGLSFFHLNEYETALKRFKKVTKQNENKYIEDAEWYTALSYKELNKKSKTKNTLLDIVKRNGKYKKQAEEKLSKIED